MDIAIIGYGKMGKELNDAAIHDGYNVVGVFDDSQSLKNAQLSNAVCIDFSTPTALAANYQIIAEKCQAAVIGTTGWENIQQEVCAYFTAQNKPMIYASNFAIGMNIYFCIIETAAKLFNQFGGYEPFLTEMHHKQKKDAPSGTAKVLGNILQSVFGKHVDASVVRCGNIKGIHEVGFESEDDRILIKHEAYSRKGFVAGALLAAKWTAEIKGAKKFLDIIKTKLCKG
jgi:4-hydroxy-tetrahydrodipicolinate reductase